MTQTALMARLFTQMWIQKFKAQPIGTVFGTLLAGGLFAGLIFLSVFFALGLMVVGVVGLVYFKLFGRGATLHVEGHVRKDFTRPTPPGRTTRADVLEGDFTVVESDKARLSDPPE